MNEALNNAGRGVDDEERTTPTRAWEVMVDEAQLKMHQERIISKCYCCVHGTRLYEPEAKHKNSSESICYWAFYSCMLQIGSKCVEFSSFACECNGINIKFKHREIDTLLQHHVEVEEWFDFKEDNQSAGCMELVIGGDHGKGSCTMIVSIVVCF